MTAPPNPQLPEGMTAESRIRSRFKMNQWFVVSDYEQTRPDGSTYTAHGLHGWDPRQEKFTFYWFDSDGWDPGHPALGEWHDDTLQFEQNTSMGRHRYTYEFTGDDAYSLKLEHSSDGKEWSVVFEETFQRAVR